MSHLRSLGERIHSAADELPLTNVGRSGSDNLDDLDESGAGAENSRVTAVAVSPRLPTEPSRKDRAQPYQDPDHTRANFPYSTHRPGILAGQKDVLPVPPADEESA